MGFDALTLYRLARRLDAHRVPFAPGALRKLGQFVFTAYLPHTAQIGEGTVVAYGGAGVFIHPKAVIGKYCLLAPFVGIGGRPDAEGVAVIGDYVRIGSGAKILGPVKIGDYAVVGANSVVVKDVPPGAVVIGNPARVVQNLADPAAAYEREMARPTSAIRSRDRGLRNVVVGTAAEQPAPNPVEGVAPTVQVPERLPS